MEQIAIGDVLRKDVTEVDRLIQGTAEEAKKMLGEIETINGLIGAVHQEMETFRKL